MVTPHRPTDSETREAWQAYSAKREKETAGLSEESDELTAASVRGAYPEILGACGLGQEAVEFIRANVTVEKVGSRVAALQQDIASRMKNALAAADAGHAQEAEKLRRIMAVAARHKLQPFRDLGLHFSKDVSARLTKKFGPQAA